MKILTTLIVAALLLISCGKQEKIKLNYKVVEVDGVQIYKNSNKPSVLELPIKIVEEVVLQGDVENEEESFVSAPMPLQCDFKKNIYLFDKSTAKLKKFDKDGNFISSFGGQGTGPGEYQMPMGFFLMADSLYVIDAAAQNLVQFNIDGSFIKKVTMTNGMPMMIKTVSEDKFIGYRISPEINENDIKLVVTLSLMDSKFNNIATISERKIQFDPEKPMNPLDMISPFEVGKDELFVAEKSTDKFKIVVYDFSGKKKYVIEKQYMQVKFSKDELKKVNDIFAKNINIQDVNAHVDNKLKDSIYSLLYDKYGRLWVKTSRVNEEIGSYVFDVFKDGVFLKTVELEIKKGSDFENLSLNNEMLTVHNIENSEIKVYSY